MQLYQVHLVCRCDKCGKQIGIAQLAYEFPVTTDYGWLMNFQLNQTMGGAIECLECTRKSILEAAKYPEEEEREYNWED